MNIMTLQGYKAKIEYDEELDLFRGEILGLNGSADFYGATSAELRQEFKKSLQVFLDVCREKGIEPMHKSYVRGSLSIPIALHEQLKATAKAAGKSVNALVQETLRQVVH